MRQIGSALLRLQRKGALDKLVDLRWEIAWHSLSTFLLADGIARERQHRKDERRPGLRLQMQAVVNRVQCEFQPV